MFRSKQPMTQGRRGRNAFTLIEILIVVIILGVLAAIVIPQFATATGDTRKASVRATVQTLRGGVALYRLQHKDVLPAPANFWSLMTRASDADGNIPPAAGQPVFGPYMQDIPKNALNNDTTLSDSAVAAGSQIASSAGFQYDYTGGSGYVWGTDSDGKTVLP